MIPANPLIGSPWARSDCVVGDHPFALSCKSRLATWEPVAHIATPLMQPCVSSSSWEQYDDRSETRNSFEDGRILLDLQFAEPDHVMTDDDIPF